MQKPIKMPDSRDGFNPFQFIMLPILKGKKADFMKAMNVIMEQRGFFPTYLLKNPNNPIFQIVKQQVIAEGDELEAVMYLVNYKNIIEE